MSTSSSAFTEPDRPTNLQIRFLTIGGSSVDVTGPGHSSDKHRWDCHGCKDTSRYPEENHLWDIREKANTHAGLCRAIPLT
ncbi:hypothetical protein [Streptomyces katsurahamanus]|uniref:Uncharacterized protein n=1 Tax=Streptomyces katsurahamanus TaxID=2577098 RepID=A0ABW9NP77_9ACTN|nr:hypothetical protein [Streptomyces katsurahamanus]MQS35121.1 hypothetical protein [Streptomyces katsurahamanus]